jgi:hypothetical protein
MIQITIDTGGLEFAGAAKWPELSRVLRDLADKFEQYTQDKFRIPMILMDAFGRHTGRAVEISGPVPTDVFRASPPLLKRRRRVSTRLMS